ncbi:MAG: hypothetical protein LBL35_03980 [Clostridiales bacterium]|nr:hypothetical protein [Clostridiales bacterium]
MEGLLAFRETLIDFYKRFEVITRFLLKLIIGAFLFYSIQCIGRPVGQLAIFSRRPYSFAFIALMALLFSIFPPMASFTLIIVGIAAQMSAVPASAVFVAMFLLCVMFFYARLAPDESVIILAVYFAYILKIPYAVPIIAGIYFGLSSIVPVVIGVFIWHFIPVVKSLIETDASVSTEALDLPAAFSGAFAALFDSARANETWVFTAVIFAFVIIIVRAVSRMSIDYAKELAIAAGAAVNVICFIIVAIIADMEISLIGAFIFTAISAAFAFAVSFFDVALDYRSAERVRFEDENNYYIVKIIPKVALTRRRRVIRRIQGGRRE